MMIQKVDRGLEGVEKYIALQFPDYSGRCGNKAQSAIPKS
jgi:hypothetical protein